MGMSSPPSPAPRTATSASWHEAAPNYLSRSAWCMDRFRQRGGLLRLSLEIDPIFLHSPPQAQPRLRPQFSSPFSHLAPPHRPPNPHIIVRMSSGMINLETHDKSNARGIHLTWDPGRRELAVHLSTWGAHTDLFEPSAPSPVGQIFQFVRSRELRALSLIGKPFKHQLVSGV